MSRRRAPSPPPRIEGYEYVRAIGSGGFSDVFLYQQHRSGRQVAVKVLLKEWTSEAQRTAFDAEADLMATLSTHPSIVTMYHAAVSPDGRPYLTMEYCSRPNLGVRYRKERFSVAEVLRTGVQIAGAVETVHRAGILHRDIKPANILITDYGQPALTDFGISATLDDAPAAEGMSIPWSPPETFAQPPTASTASDVWALAATLFSLLAGRTPFERSDAPNTNDHLISRIETVPLAPTSRSDVPPSLELALATAMAKSPANRYASALEFGRALQRIQSELAMEVTPLALRDDAGHEVPSAPADPGDDDGTRLRGVVTIDPGGRTPLVAGQPTPGGIPSFAAVAQGPGARATSTAIPAARVAVSDVLTDRSAAGAAAWADSAIEDTVIGTSVSQVTDDAAQRKTWPLATAVVAVLAIAGGVVAYVQSQGKPESTDAPSGTTAVPGQNIGELVPTVVNLAGEYDAAAQSAVFAWSDDPDEAKPGDTYRWRRVDPLHETKPAQTTERQVSLPAEPGERICIEVVVVRNGKPSYEAEQACSS